MSRQWRSDDTTPWVYGFGDGSDGDLTVSSNTTEAPIDSSCSGTAGASTLSATNVSFSPGQIILIHQSRGTGAGNWELAKITAYSAGTITLDAVLQNTYTDSGASQAQVRVLRQYNNVTVNSGITWTAKAWNGNVGGIIGFFAKGTITITGTITASEKGFRGGAGGGGTSYTQAQCGEGSSGAQATQQSANGNGAGGNYSSVAWAGGGGGGGGNRTSGSAGSTGGSGGAQTPGAAGAAAGHAELTTMVFGGGGGGGGGDSQSGDGRGHGGTGAIGGGITAIFGSDIAISGTVSSKGGSGNAGSTVEGPYPHHGGSGGGAGGSILLKAKTAALGTTKITAGAGSGGGFAFDGGSGGNGSVGRIHLDYSVSVSGTTSPTLSSRSDASITYPVSGGAWFLV